MAVRLRCDRGHFIPATTTDRACRCVLAPRRRHRRRLFSDVDLWGQGLTVRQKYCITLVPITGSYL